MDLHVVQYKHISIHFVFVYYRN